MSATAPGFEDEMGEEKPAPYYYPNEGAFVQEFLIPTFRVRFDTKTHWCLQWWEHPEAWTVLRALWHSWENQRQEPWKSAEWLTHTLYPLWDRLTGEHSPFRGCKYGAENEAPKHLTGADVDIRAFPMDPIPDGLFEDVETIADTENQ